MDKKCLFKAQKAQVKINPASEWRGAEKKLKFLPFCCNA